MVVAQYQATAEYKRKHAYAAIAIAAAPTRASSVRSDFNNPAAASWHDSKSGVFARKKRIAVGIFTNKSKDLNNPFLACVSSV